MPLSSILRRRRNTVPFRKESIPSPVLEPPDRPTQAPQPPDVPPSNLQVLPPEIWLQILEFVPFERLWFLRGTCWLFNKLALVRAWQTIRDSEIGVKTSYNSEHEPLSYVSESSELLSPALPQSILSDLRGTVIDDPVFTNTTMARWHVKAEHPADCEQLRMSYNPFMVEIRFGSFEARYYIYRPRPTYGRLQDFARMETWSTVSNTKPRSGKVTKLFSSKSGTKDRNPIYKGLTPLWGVQYMAKYGHGRNDEGRVVSQLVKVTLLEVSLPVTQVVCTFIDALNHSDPVEY